MVKTFDQFINEQENVVQRGDLVKRAQADFVNKNGWKFQTSHNFFGAYYIQDDNGIIKDHDDWDETSFKLDLYTNKNNMPCAIVTPGYESNKWSYITRKDQDDAAYGTPRQLSQVSDRYVTLKQERTLFNWQQLSRWITDILVDGVATEFTSYQHGYSYSSTKGSIDFISFLKNVFRPIEKYGVGTGTDVFSGNNKEAHTNPFDVKKVVNIPVCKELKALGFRFETGHHKFNSFTFSAILDWDRVKYYGPKYAEFAVKLEISSKWSCTVYLGMKDPITYAANTLASGPGETYPELRDYNSLMKTCVSHLHEALPKYKAEIIPTSDHNGYIDNVTYNAMKDIW